MAYSCQQAGTTHGGPHDSQPVLPPLRRRALCVSSSDESVAEARPELPDEDIWILADEGQEGEANLWANNQPVAGHQQQADQEEPQVKNKGKGKKSKATNPVNPPMPAALPTVEEDELPDLDLPDVSHLPDPQEPQPPKKKGGRPAGKKSKANIGRKSRKARSYKKHYDENQETVQESQRDIMRQRREEVDPLSEEAVAARAADAARKTTRRQNDVYRQAENDARINFDDNCQNLLTFRLACLEQQAAFFMGENPQGYFNQHDLGDMDEECEHGCGALHFEQEKSSELCCGSKGQLKELEVFPDPPQPLFDLIMCRDQNLARKAQREEAQQERRRQEEGAAGTSQQAGAPTQGQHDEEDAFELLRKAARSGEFHHHIRGYNSALALASIQVTEATMAGFNPTLRIVGVMSHRIGDVMSTQGGEPKFMQLDLQR